MKVTPYLKILAEKNGSDLYFSTGVRPKAKFNGVLTPLGKDSAPPGWVDTLAMELMDDRQKKEFRSKPEMNLTLSLNNIGCFRVNIFKQRNETAMVISSTVTDIPNIDELGLPEVLKKVTMAKRGLILFAGGTGSGKSTTLAALIDHRNTHSKGHIITIEDPVEYIHQHKACIINQREVGVDTDSFEDALQNTLRQAPDVIFIDEIRDQQTMDYALAFAESGRLVLSTLYANNASQALARIISFYPKERHSQLLSDLSINLKSFVSQKLIPTTDNKRCVAIEVLLNSQHIAELILQGAVAGIHEVMEKSAAIGMQTFDTALYNLFNNGKINLDEALKHADSENDLRARIELSAKNDNVSMGISSSTMDGLSLVEQEVEEEEKEEEAKHVGGHYDFSVED